MIPLKDDIPHRHFPVVTIIFIVVNVLIFFYQLSLGKDVNVFIMKMGTVPYEIIHNKDIPPYLGLPVYTTLFTSMFLHGGFIHLIGNMLYLWIFGDNVEDSFGHLGFLVVYLCSGLAGSALHIFTQINSKIPSIGASGAISGVLGAYFLLYPKARVLALVPLGYFIRIIYLPAFLFLGIWILMQLLFGVSGGGGGVAWFAHIGGFVAGLLFAIPVRRKPYYSY